MFEERTSKKVFKGGANYVEQDDNFRYIDLVVDPMTQARPLVEGRNKMEHYDLGEEQLIIFDMKDFRHDYDKFIEGRYSAFGVDSKIAILDYFGGQGKISSYVQSFLTPDKDLHKEYSEFLNVDFELIQEVHEICSAPDIIKETLYYSYPMKIDLHNFKNSLSLGK